ncbi:conserved exported hypothetical protein [Candidatus Accumulibacter aalborgensis]|uniref:Lipoprotein n=1 Tax=Candidatus Accumulibacter aalborgensis TaxID=1860102 RepID=A0A1A8XZS9_9PROT|nr:DUF1302 family protein [Candidatus Accumulibacter aalborgensis]SBT10192.1 conserved exported hypothetical protein [Candidatus Accumulibacter aalborgensis]
MKNRTRKTFACLAPLLATLPVWAASGIVDAGQAPAIDRSARSSSEPTGGLLAAKSENALPKSRDALFDDDQPAEEAEPPAEEPSGPVSRESLFGDDALMKPAAETASAASPTRTAGFKGFVDNVMAYTYPQPSHWSEMMTRFDLSTQGSLGSNVKWRLGARIDYDAVYSLTDFYPQAVDNNQRFNVLLRENYLDIGAGDWDFRVGRQHVIWGEMVGLLFGDVVSAKDVRHFVLPEFDILRIPQWAIRAEYFKDDFHAELLWIPVASYDNIGKPGAEFYDYTLPAPPGMATTFLNEKFPTRSLANTNYGLRLSMLRNGWDVAAFAYSSMSVAPTFYREIIAAPQPTVVYQARHDRIDQVGSTVAKDFGSVVLKGEAVYTSGQQYQVTNLTDPDGLVLQKTLLWVLGLDFTQFTDTRINVQVFQTHFFDHNAEIIPSANENGYSLLVSHKFGDKVEAQALWVASMNRTDWMLRPRVSWNFEKNWRLALGVDIFNGSPLGYFGRYDAKDRVYSELRYSF